MNGLGFFGGDDIVLECVIEPGVVDEISSSLQYPRQLLHILEMLSKDSSFHRHRRCKEKQQAKRLNMPKSAETELPKQ